MLSFLNIKSSPLEVFCEKVLLNILQSSLKNIKNIHDAAFNLRLQHLYFHKNFAEVLRTPILQNADRLLLLKHLLKMKIAAPDKFLLLMRKFEHNMVSNRPELNVEDTCNVHKRCSYMP